MRPFTRAELQVMTTRPVRLTSALAILTLYRNRGQAPEWVSFRAEEWAEIEAELAAFPDAPSDRAGRIAFAARILGVEVRTFDDATQDQLEALDVEPNDEDEE